MFNLNPHSIDYGSPGKPIGSLSTGVKPMNVRLCGNASQTLTEIDADGILRVRVDHTDENAAKFVECIENFLKRRMIGIEVKS